MHMQPVVPRPVVTCFRGTWGAEEGDWGSCLSMAGELGAELRLTERLVGSTWWPGSGPSNNVRSPLSGCVGDEERGSTPGRGPACVEVLHNLRSFSGFLGGSSYNSELCTRVSEFRACLRPALLVGTLMLFALSQGPHFRKCLRMSDRDTWLSSAAELGRALAGKFPVRGLPQELSPETLSWSTRMCGCFPSIVHISGRIPKNCLCVQEDYPTLVPSTPCILLSQTMGWSRGMSDKSRLEQGALK